MNEEKSSQENAISPREVRNVTVDISGKMYRYYMTDSMKLLSAELEKLGCRPPKRDEWHTNPNLAQSVREKMLELGVRYSICEEAGILNYYDGKNPFFISLKFLKDPSKFIVLPRAQISDMIKSCKQNLSDQKKIYERTKNFCALMLAGMDLIQEYYGLASPETLKAYFGKTEEELVREKVIDKKDATFPDLLRRFRDERKLTDVALYTKANISKQTYHNIISGKVVPTRESAVALSFALDLNLDDTELLLSVAGHSFLPTDAFMRIVKECITLGKDIQEANKRLDEAGLSPLGNALK